MIESTEQLVSRLRYELDLARAHVVVAQREVQRAGTALEEARARRNAAFENIYTAHRRVRLVKAALAKATGEISDED
jgi:hypothetical protein